MQAAFVTRLDTTGELDTDFGDQGVVHLDLDHATQTSGHDVTVLSGGEIDTISLRQLDGMTSRGTTALLRAPVGVPSPTAFS